MPGAQARRCAIREQCRMLVSGLTADDIQHETGHIELVAFADRLADLLIANRAVWRVVGQAA